MSVLFRSCDATNLFLKKCIDPSVKKVVIPFYMSIQGINREIIIKNDRARRIMGLIDRLKNTNFYSFKYFSEESCLVLMVRSSPYVRVHYEYPFWEEPRAFSFPPGFNPKDILKEEEKI